VSEVILKSVIRDNCLRSIRQLNSSQLAEKSRQVSQNLSRQLSDESGFWLGYMSLNSEPKISWRMVSQKISWCFPKVVEQELKFYVDVQSFEESKLGVQEPIDGIECELSQVTGAVVPGLAFDQRGVRLGRGKGYYDRTLQAYRGFKIGVCFDETFLKTLPSENHDLTCDQIVTDKIIFNVQKSTQNQG
jgi:5-formyltetrahydrofolate cyclo-ligase